jgi:hypothetical protein
MNSWASAAPYVLLAAGFGAWLHWRWKERRRWRPFGRGQ